MTDDADLLFGDSESCTEDEAHIIFSDLPTARKLAKLKVLRGETTVKKLSFKKRVTADDRIHAHAFGIILD
jgi:hypothetical protein